MMRYLLPLLLLLSLISPAGAAVRVTVERGSARVLAKAYEARIEGGSVVHFRDRTTGEVLLDGKPVPPFVRFIERNKPMTATGGPSEFAARMVGKDAVEFRGRVASGAAKADVRLVFRALDDEMVVTGEARGTGTFEGVASIGFALGATATHTQVIVPATGGNCFSSGGLRAAQTFEWPISWEAAMVQVQGKKGGLLACAFEPFKRFKNLAMDPDGDGWRVSLESENNAPFEGKTQVTSLAWHIRPYSGEWRGGAAIYRDWHRKTFGPSMAEEPSWVRDVRAEIHVGMELGTLDALVKAGIDPKQTLLYVAGWRTNGYDRNYPDYTPSDKLSPFMEKAHEMGFHVMLHVNYFGCDPKMPEYERFKAQQVRHKHSGDPLWWDWTRADPPIKFAYINAASAEWRKLFVGKMTELVRATGADALHLDQTLCIFNDKNGLIDGTNMAQGNLLLHKELKAALPRVALSGEGLDEVTMIHEAFAQRHVMGVDHVNNTYNKVLLGASHPVSSFLFGARTKPYIYLGCAGPDRDQVNFAWRDAYRHWGVLPGYAWPTPAKLAEPSPCERQLLDEMRTFQRFRLDPAMEGSWPENVDFPYASWSGERFAYLSRPDGWSLSRTDGGFRPTEDFSRVISGADSVRLPGTVPGAICYDSDAVTGLDPEAYYVYLPERRSMDAFHIESADPNLRIETGFAGPSVVMARTMESRTVCDSATLVQSVSGWYASPEGRRVPLTGDVTDRTGSVVQPRGPGLFMHPPWKGELSGKAEPGSSYGATIARFQVDVPKEGRAFFEASCRLDDGAVGKSDGVRFRLTAEAGDRKLSAQTDALSAAPAPLRLELTALAGQKVTLELTATAGPKNDFSFDWGLVERPRVTATASSAKCRIIWPKGMAHRVAPGYADLRSGVEHSEEMDIAPGAAVMATSLAPSEVVGTVKLADLPQCNQLAGVETAEGAKEEPPIGLSVNTCGGAERQALFSHPPNGGSRMLHYFVRIPSGSSVTLRSAAGLRDGSKSEGVTFQVWRNGRVLWSKHVMPADGWQPVEVPLGKSNGEPMMLTLVTDSEGDYYCDWALWADPELVVEPDGP